MDDTLQINSSYNDDNNNDGDNDSTTTIYMLKTTTTLNMTGLHLFLGALSIQMPAGNAITCETLLSEHFSTTTTTTLNA